MRTDKNNHREWAAPRFIIPKKDGQVRFIYYLSLLKKKIKHRPYTIPHIKDMLNKIYNFTHAMTLYLIMGYYNISLTDAAKKVCTITTPFVKYKYNRLPMGSV